MKRFLLLFLIVISYTTLNAQSSTKKYNNILNRDEYFDSKGNMTGYDIYNSILGQWEHYSTNQPALGAKQEWDVVAPYDTEFLLEMAIRAQELYNAYPNRNFPLNNNLPKYESVYKKNEPIYLTRTAPF
ncbi:hypothetical protein [Dysgonomonas sp. 520]|uniref:hypothetical protein n=1 Tax=Dysgonomonas sp. 520 TaxID=2302931 RepID=UPI0013D82432|nr:hypothetical protein [Dysgonomonas sp. 520]NDW11269.1 hypothetical protein [Dysgonomonas sp. 520]